MISGINFLSRKLIWFPAFIIFLFCFLTNPIKAEEPEEALRKINERIDLIKQASREVSIDYKILSAVIYVERTLNYEVYSIKMEQKENHDPIQRRMILEKK
jgi:hypothetical protein